MKQRKAWAAVLGLSALGLTGCPMLETMNLPGSGGYTYIPTEQRPPAGSVLPGSTPPGAGGGTTGGGTTGGDGTSGGGSTGIETGTNPTSVSLSGALRIDALYPKSSAVSVSISNAPKGIAAFSAPSTAAQTLSVSWSGQSGLQAFRSLALESSVISTSDQEKKASSLRDRVGLTLSSAPTQRQVQATRTLTKGMLIPVKIDSETPNITAEVMHIDAGTDGRQRFAILVDTRDKGTLFGDGAGTTLLDKLAKRLRDPLSNSAGIFKTNRALFGNDPTVAEASAAGMSLDQEETLFIFSRAVNNDSDITRRGEINEDGTKENDVLGYFYLGDFAANDPYTNRSKALYLASRAAYDSRSDESAFHDLSATISHELTHLLFSWQRVKAVGLSARGAENRSRADAWIDEGLAMYAMAANGYGLESSPGVKNPRASENLAGHVQYFLSNAPRFSLTAFYTDEVLPADRRQGNPYDAYGMAYLFAQYLVDQQGTDVIGKILGSTKNGIDAGEPITPEGIEPTGIVSDAVARDGGNLSTIFANFAAALALDGTSALAATTDDTVKKRYDIQGINLRQSPFIDIPFNGPAGVTTAPYTPKVFGVSFLKPGSLNTTSTLQFTGNSGTLGRLLLFQ